MEFVKQYRVKIVVSLLSLIVGALGFSEYKKYLQNPDFQLFVSEVMQLVDTAPTSSPVASPMITSEGVLGVSDSATPSVDLHSAEIATVSAVIDGDTVTLLDGRKVRYVGIDAPETRSSDAQVKCFHAQATAENTRLVLNKTVQLLKDTRNIDKYGRLLRYVYVDGTFVNEQLVAGGFARAKWYPPDTKEQVTIDAAQELAQEEKRGLWNICQ